MNIEETFVWEDLILDNRIIGFPRNVWNYWALLLRSSKCQISD
jgi:hypothetical protein